MLRWLYKLSDRARDHARRKTWDPDLSTGRLAEDLAHRYLQKQGMTVIARNYRTPSGSGELDIVAMEGETLVVVEVKSRSSTEFGLPERKVDHDKEVRVARGAEDFARRAGIPLDKVRFDVLAIVFEESTEIRHLRDAFHPGVSA